MADTTVSPMNTVLILSLSAAGVLVLLGAPLYFAFRNSAVGYQDAEGFHLGIEPKPVEAPLLEMPSKAGIADVAPRKTPEAIKSRADFAVAGDS